VRIILASLISCPAGLRSLLLVRERINGGMGVVFLGFVACYA
jgi:hypothetical protein